MGTVISLELFEDKPDAVEAVYHYLQKAEKEFSANDNCSELMRINRSAGKQPVTVNSNLFSVIKQAVEFSKEYRTSFNIALGPLVKLWRIGFADQRVPLQSEIKSALQLIDIDSVELDESRHQVYLMNYGMELDLGAIAKGYFADQIIVLLKYFGINNGIINLGGNTVTFGVNQVVSSHLWKVGIQSPWQYRGTMVGEVQCRACSAVTSGIGERNFQYKGRLYHHIIDPQTGYPLENDLAQVTIFSSSSLYGEVLSTVALFSGIDNGLLLINQIPNVSGVFISKTGRIRTTSGINFKAIA